MNKSQSTVTHYVAFVQPSYAVPFTQAKLAGETFSPILFEGKGRWTQTSHNGTDVSERVRLIQRPLLPAR